MYSATSDSLVIIDEFGRGTSEIDGSALLASVLAHFLERGLECPHIFAATHLHRVLDLLPTGPLMQIQVIEICYLKQRFLYAFFCSIFNLQYNFQSNEYEIIKVLFF